MILGLPIIKLEQFNLTQQLLILSSVPCRVVLLALLSASEHASFLHAAVLPIADLRRKLKVTPEGDVVEDVREMLALAVPL